MRKKQWEKRGDGVCRLGRTVHASPNRTQRREWQHQLCPHGFHHLDQRQWVQPPPHYCRTGEGNSTPHLFRSERRPHVQKGSSETPALDFKRPMTKEGVFKKYQIFKNLQQIIFFTFSEQTFCCSVNFCSKSQSSGSVLIPEQQNSTSKSARQSILKVGAMLSITL